MCSYHTTWLHVVLKGVVDTCTCSLAHHTIYYVLAECGSPRDNANKKRDFKGCHAMYPRDLVIRVRVHFTPV